VGDIANYIVKGVLWQAFDSAEMLAKLMRRTGHDVQTAYSGPAALDVAAAILPDAVLLHIGLPGMNGARGATGARGNQARSRGPCRPDQGGASGRCYTELRSRQAKASPLV